MSNPDRIERTVELNHRPEVVWRALTTAEGLGAWFGNSADIDLRPGGQAHVRWDDHGTQILWIEVVEPPHRSGFSWEIHGLPASDTRRTYVELTLEPTAAGTRLWSRPASRRRPRLPTAATSPAGSRSSPSTSMPQSDVPADCEAIAAAVFTALADPTRRSILAELAAHGAASATDLADRLPISRQAIAKHLGLLADAGLVLAEPGERRRVRFRLQSAPMAVAQSFLAALARDWDRHLDALRRHLDQAPPAEAQPHPSNALEKP